MPDNLPTRPPSTDVYAIHGADPEVLAYAMAKYCRSSLTLRESRCARSRPSAPSSS